jgi:hypothetical protein
MSSILSEIKNTLETSSIKDTVMDIYNTMFHKLNKVKDILSKKEEPEILPKIIKEAAPVKDEGYVSPAKPKTPGEIIKATLTNIKDVIWDYGFKFIVYFFYIMLASLVANDMIIYAAPIRAFFFVFTLFFTSTIFQCAVVVAFYYLLKKGYDYYNQNLSSATVKPPLCFPMIFAILPLTTYYPTSPFVRFFLWIFMYQKSDKPVRMEKENKRLEIIMSQYWDDLNGSFEYLDKIKDTPPFSDLYKNIEKKLTIDDMHPIQKPEKILEPTNASPNATPNASPNATPQVVEKENAEKKEEEKKEKVQFFKPQGEGQEEAEKKKEEEERKKQKASEPAPMPESIANQLKRKEKPAAMPATIASQAVAPPSYNATQSTSNQPPAYNQSPSNQPQSNQPPAYNQSTSNQPPSNQPPAYNQSASNQPPAYNQSTSNQPPAQAIKPTQPVQPTQATQPPPSYNSKINGQSTPNPNPFRPS